MALLSRKPKEDKPSEDDMKLSDALDSRIKRGRERAERFAAKTDECWEFVRGNHYAWVDEKNVLQFQPTVTSVRGTGKPRHRARQARNLILDHVSHIAASATSRIPSYQVVPSTGDTQDQSAAKLSEKVLHFGYNRWGIRKASLDAVMHAVVGGEAFAWPYFDNTVGPYITGEGVGEGEIRVGIYGKNECYWEPGMRFEDSPWHAVEQARSIDQVKATQDYYEGSLTPDASSRAISQRGKGQSDKAKLVLVTDYLERPTPKNPKGKWVTIANGRKICPDRPYPGKGSEPVLRKLSYLPDPDADRDMGLVAHLLDPQRTFNDAHSKAVEWKNLCLLPRIVVTPGLFKKQRWTDEPGKVYEIPQPGQNFEVVPTPPVPAELFEMADRAERDMGRIAGQNDIPTQVESGKGIQALLEKDDSRRGLFYASLASWFGQIGHDCLCLVQDHYTEPRLLQIKGDGGTWDTIEDFKGSYLRDQVDVRVFVDSIEPQTKQAIETRMMTYAQLGWISPAEAINAVETGTSEAITRALVLDEARAGRIIQRLKQGPEALFSMPMLPTGRMKKEPQLQPAVDPMTGQPRIDEMGQPVLEQVMVETGEPEMSPGWMPRYSDNLPVFRQKFEAFMKSEDYERLERGMQEAAIQIYTGVIQLEAEKQAEQAAAQTAQAQDYGSMNAAKPQAPKPNPSFPKLQQPNGAPSQP